jgi:mannitol-1-phosphate/altronate dehydrogenase
MSRVHELYEQAIELDDAEFEELFDLLAARFPAPEIHESWLRVARERSKALRDRTTDTVPWAEVRERMFRRVNGG